jgi:hypothetical protein
MQPVASGPSGQSSGPPWELSRETGPLPKLPDTAGQGPQGNEPDAEGDKGLPRRIRQASLAPQLRANPPQRRVTMASSGPTPTEIRRTMSALQRGWQEGRTEPMPGSPSGQPPWERPADGGPLATAFGAPGGTSAPFGTSAPADTDAPAPTAGPAADTSGPEDSSVTPDSSVTSAQGARPEGGLPADAGSSGAAPGGPESTAAGEDERRGTDGT